MVSKISVTCKILKKIEYFLLVKPVGKNLRENQFELGKNLVNSVNSTGGTC